MNRTSSGTNPGADPKNRIEPLVEQARTAAGHVAGQARDQVEQQLDARKDQAVEAIGTVADAIRGTSDKLKGVGPLGDVAGRAADRIEGLGKFFEGKDLGEIVDEANRFARREPALFLGAAFALGLIGGRFLKSSPRGSSYRPDGDDLEARGRYGNAQQSFGSMEGARASYARELAPVTPRVPSTRGTTSPGMGATQAGTPARPATEPARPAPATQGGGGALPDAKITTGAEKPGSA